MKLPGFSKELEPKERLLAILMVGAVVIGATYIMLDSEESVVTQVPPKVNENIASAAQKPAMPVGYQPGMTVKDPFAVAPEYVPPLQQKQTDPGVRNTPAHNANEGVHNNTGAASHQAGSAERAKPKLPELRLKGVAGAEGSYVAIIQMDNKSQPYAVNEAVGPYRLVAINNDSAILNGPDGQKVIQLGR